MLPKTTDGQSTDTTVTTTAVQPADTQVDPATNTTDTTTTETTTTQEPEWSFDTWDGADDSLPEQWKPAAAYYGKKIEELGASHANDKALLSDAMSSLEKLEQGYREFLATGVNPELQANYDAKLTELAGIKQQFEQTQAELELERRMARINEEYNNQREYERYKTQNPAVFDKKNADAVRYAVETLGDAIDMDHLPYLVTLSQSDLQTVVGAMKEGAPLNIAKKLLNTKPADDSIDVLSRNATSQSRTAAPPTKVQAPAGVSWDDRVKSAARKALR